MYCELSSVMEAFEPPWDNKEKDQCQNSGICLHLVSQVCCSI